MKYLIIILLLFSCKNGEMEWREIEKGKKSTQELEVITNNSAATYFTVDLSNKFECVEVHDGLSAFSGERHIFLFDDTACKGQSDDNGGYMYYDWTFSNDAPFIWPRTNRSYAVVFAGMTQLKVITFEEE